jgi:hypothetical protein
MKGGLHVERLEELTPRAIVAELDKFIVGQDQAKKSVAIALRNRYRRLNLKGSLRDEVIPKNILMIGPTGVGKTEIARRLARLVNAPFTKVEATKFTEVGYVGRDVDAIIRDLVENAIRMVKSEKMARVYHKAEAVVDDRLLDLLAPLPSRESGKNPFAMLMGGFGVQRDDDAFERRLEEAERKREDVRARLVAGELEDTIIEVSIEDKTPPMLEVFSGAGVEEMGINMQDLFGGAFPGKTIGLSAIAFAMILVMLIMSIVLRYTSIGRNVYALGGSREAAERAGISIWKTQFFVYCLAGMLAGIASILNVSMIRYVNPFNVYNVLMDVIAAVVLGGAKLSGGSGTIFGTFLGVFTLYMIKNSLILMGIPSTWDSVIVGLIIIVSVAFTASRKKPA